MTPVKETSNSQPTSASTSPANPAKDNQLVSAHIANTKSGWFGVLIVVALLIIGLISVLIFPEWLGWGVIVPIGSTLLFLSLAGHYLVQPNEGLVLILFGKYRGTTETPGWHWVNPFTRIESRKVSLRVHNFTTSVSKVNDAEGNPIEISAVVVWRVVDTARAVFEVDDFEDFVHVQSETAIRHLGTQYPYDDFDGGDRLSLRSHPDQVAGTLRTEVQERLERAGVKVIETRLNHLAYATEIAEAMLRRQQAAAVVAARRTIVEGAVGMVEDALELLTQRSVVTLDEERKSALVANLLVVLTSEQQTTPIINTGSMS